MRAARPTDAGRLGEMQSQAWRAAYAELLPADTLAELEPAALAERWREAVTDPPSPRHRLLVAAEGGKAVGFAVLTPAEDEDLDPAEDAELALLVVDPAHLGRGHGSRLLAAAVDHLREDGFRVAYTWLTPSDEALRAFLESGGWGPDGAHRSLDLRGDGEVVVRQVRLHSDISPDS